MTQLTITSIEDSVKTAVTNILSVQVATVKFTKVDGTVREMKATLSPQFIEVVPLVEGAEPRRERKSNPDVRTVYDVDAKTWKSFRWDKLISVTTEDK
jgi:hypothetical protein